MNIIKKSHIISSQSKPCPQVTLLIQIDQNGRSSIIFVIKNATGSNMKSLLSISSISLHTIWNQIYSYYKLLDTVETVSTLCELTQFFWSKNLSATHILFALLNSQFLHFLLPPKIFFGPLGLLIYFLTDYPLDTSETVPNLGSICRANHCPEIAFSRSERLWSSLQIFNSQ